jgi:ribosome biogenesis SPOUT family RNA methylase Rps3
MKMRGKHLGFGAALIALSVQPAAAATNEFCITSDETRLVLSYVAPVLVEGFVKTCTPFMAPQSALLTLGPDMAANYRAVANPTDADIEALIAKVGTALGDAPPKDMTLALIKSELISAMAKDIKAEDCTMADRFVTDLAALPAANMLGMIETAAMMAELKDRQKKAKRTKKPIAPSVFCEG